MKLQAICFLVLSYAAATLAEDVELAPVSLRMGSIASYDDAPDVFLNDLANRTVKHLNGFLSHHFTTVLDENYFGEVQLVVESSNKVDVDVDSFMSTVVFAGSATFNQLPLPQDDFLIQVVSSAFVGKANKMFIEVLQESTTTLFLQELNYMEVNVGDNAVSVQEVTPLSQQQDEQDNEEDGSSDDNDVDVFGVNVPLLYLVLGASGIAILLAMGIVCFIARRRRIQRRKELQEVAPSAKNSRKTKRKRGKKHNDLEMASTRSPSPVRSLASQESSMFTYNPKSKISSDVETLSLSNIKVVTQPMDVEAWQRGMLISPITPAFGQDISAIETADESPYKKRTNELSFIDEEEDDEEATPSSTHYLSRDKLSQVNRRSPTMTKRARSHVVVTSSPNTSMLSETGWSDAAGNSFMSEGSDVISDLKNLSVQINKYRGGRR